MTRASRWTTTATCCATPTAGRCRRLPARSVCDRAGDIYGFRAHIDGSWYRCCGGKVRQLRDCCAHRNTRINGDAALTGYCYGGRKVFCVQYYDTKVPC